MGRVFAVVPPRSCVLVAHCTREWARERIAAGEFPRGSIWFPGLFGMRPEVGDLFAPDPNWNPPNRAVGVPPAEGSYPIILSREA